MPKKSPYCVILKSVIPGKQEIYWLYDKPNEIEIKLLTLDYLYKHEMRLVPEVCHIQIKEPTKNDVRKEILVHLKYSRLHIQFIEGFSQPNFLRAKEMLTNGNAYIRKLAKESLS